MGIDLFDALGGLGAGLSTLGQGMEVKRKEALAEKLKLADEGRAEERDKRREQRAHDEEAKRVKDKVISPTANGAYKELGVNSYGGTVYEKDANQLEVDSILRSAEKERAGIDQTLSQTDVNKSVVEQNRAETKWLPEKYSLDRNLTESQIAENNAQAARASRPAAPGKTVDTSLATLTEEMAKEMKAYQGDLSPEFFRVAVREALKRAKIEHTDAREVLLKFLPEYKKKYQGK